MWEHMYLVELRQVPGGGQLPEGGWQPVLAYDWWGAQCSAVEAESRKQGLARLARSISVLVSK